MDAVGSNIRVDSRGREVMRVLPMLNEDVNEEWISDKTRYACDGLARQRLDKPYMKVDGKLQAASWHDAFDAIGGKVRGLDGSKIGAIAGDMCDAEAMTALKDLMTALGSNNIDCRQDGAKLRPGHVPVIRSTRQLPGLKTPMPACSSGLIRVWKRRLSMRDCASVWWRAALRSVWSAKQSI